MLMKLGLGCRRGVRALLEMRALGWGWDRGVRRAGGGLGLGPGLWELQGQRLGWGQCAEPPGCPTHRSRSEDMPLLPGAVTHARGVAPTLLPSRSLRAGLN